MGQKKKFYWECCVCWSILIKKKNISQYLWPLSPGPSLQRFMELFVQSVGSLLFTAGYQFSIITPFNVKKTPKKQLTWPLAWISFFCPACFIWRPTCFQCIDCRFLSDAICLWLSHRTDLDSSVLYTGNIMLLKTSIKQCETLAAEA